MAIAPTIIVTSPGGQDSVWPRTTIHTRIQGARAAPTSRKSMPGMISALNREKVSNAGARLLAGAAEVLALRRQGVDGEPRQPHADEQQQPAGRRDDVSPPEPAEVHAGTL